MHRGGGHDSLPLTALAGQATFSGCLAVLDVPSALLRARLPPGMALPAAHPASSPCLLAFGEQSNSTGFIGGWPLPWGVRYHELMVAVPVSSATSHGAGCLFVLGMACDAPWAVWNGNLHYGFNKRLASMSWDGNRFLVSTGGTRPGFDATFFSCSGGLRPPDPLTGSLAGTPLPHSARQARSLRATREWIRAAAALPVIGTRDDGRAIECRFEWDFADAVTTAGRLTLSVSPDFAELPLTASDVTCDRAYLVAGMRWRLSWPRQVDST